jgi:hypothetical protein
MSQGPAPGEWQGNPAEPQQASWEQPAYAGQTWPASPGGDPGQQVPPTYGVPGYAAPGYGAPGYGAGPYGNPPPTHLIWARIAAAGGVLFNLILGFPAGLIAMSHGRKVRQLWESGDQQAAFAASRKARTWAIASTVLDAIGVILLIVVITQSGSSKSNFNNPAVVAASIKAQLQKRISDPSSSFYSPGLKVTSVVCTPIGTNTDHCVDHFSNGQTASETAVISDNGNRYLTH